MLQDIVYWTEGLLPNTVYSNRFSLHLGIVE